MNKSEILIRAAKIIADRDNTYGAPYDPFVIAQRLKEVIRDGRQWRNLLFVEQEAIEMILTKLARAVSGVRSTEHFMDIAGYAGIAGEVAENSKPEINGTIIVTPGLRPAKPPRGKVAVTRGGKTYFRKKTKR